MNPSLASVAKAARIDLGALRRDVAEQPDAYRHERAERFGVSGEAIWQAPLAVCRFDCNIGGEIFHARAQQDLLPELPEAAVIAMDDAALHKRRETEETIERAGFRPEYSPPCSPEPNPV